MITDPVSKLEAVGKETVAKLKDLPAAVDAAGNDRDASIFQELLHFTKSISTGLPPVKCLHPHHFLRNQMHTWKMTNTPPTDAVAHVSRHAFCRSAYCLAEYGNDTVPA